MTENGSRVAVTWEAGLEAPARTLAARLALPLASSQVSKVASLHLHLTGARLELREVRPAAPGPVYAEFTSGRAAHRRRFGGGRAQPLVRAVGFKGNATPHVLDATAGLGQDAFVLASSGAVVTLVERSPVVGALLEDALKRARADPETALIAARMQLVVGNAAEVMSRLEARPDVVYLDPMYPHLYPRRRGRALPKKEMRLFRQLVGSDADASALLEAALACAKTRVVVKRPQGAPPLGGKPDGSIESKNTRFDLYSSAARSGR